MMVPRMTLLLGPPGSGKTTLLLALAGRLPKSLRVQGKVTLNGHTHDEFVPQRTAAYISQSDLHVGEMTVRETLAFSAKCQGIGTRYGEFGRFFIYFFYFIFLVQKFHEGNQDARAFLTLRSSLQSRFSGFCTNFRS